jgi:acetoin utilization protein AcuB
MSRVEHMMTSDLATIPVSATAAEAAQAMHRLGLRHLPVVDDRGHLVGILSDRDLRGPMIGIATERELTAATPVERLMTRDLVTASPGDQVGDVARKIVEHRIGAVPIVDSDNVPVGILSYVDVLRRLADDAARDTRAIELMDR